MNDTDQDRNDFRVLMMSLAVEKHYQQHVDKPLLRIYFNSMQHVPFDVIKRHMPAVSQRCKFFPRVNEWLEVIDEEEAKQPPAAGLKLLPPAAPGPNGKALYCLTCNDTGWYFPDPQKNAVKKCDCWPRNPALGAGRPPKYAKRASASREMDE